MKVGVLTQYIMWRLSQNAWFEAKQRCIQLDEAIRKESEYCFLHKIIKYSENSYDCSKILLALMVVFHGWD